MNGIAGQSRTCRLTDGATDVVIACKDLIGIDHGHRREGLHASHVAVCARRKSRISAFCRKRRVLAVCVEDLTGRQRVGRVNFDDSERADAGEERKTRWARLRKEAGGWSGGEWKEELEYR